MAQADWVAGVRGDWCPGGPDRRSGRPRTDLHWLVGQHALQVVQQLLGLSRGESHTSHFEIRSADTRRSPPPRGRRLARRTWVLPKSGSASQ